MFIYIYIYIILVFFLVCCGLIFVLFFFVSYNILYALYFPLHWGLSSLVLLPMVDGSSFLPPTGFRHQSGSCWTGMWICWPLDTDIPSWASTRWTKPTHGHQHRLTCITGVPSFLCRLASQRRGGSQHCSSNCTPMQATLLTCLHRLA